MSEPATSSSVVSAALLQGRYDEAVVRLGEASNDFSPQWREELASHIEFQTARLRRSSPLRIWERFLWLALVGPLPVRLLCDALTVLATFLLGVTRQRRRVGRAAALRWMGDIVHYRYTNFARGLWQSQILSRLLVEEDVVLKAYLSGLSGHFLGMSGRYDLSIKILTAARHHLADLVQTRPNDLRAYQYHLEIWGIEALHKGYAGLHQAARETFAGLFRQLAVKPYWWIEVFARSMRLHVAMEAVDEDLLREDALILKRSLGEAFENKYALRTTAYSALVAAIKGKRNLALSQLLESERFYDQTKVPVERSRYHFIRALAELELGEYALAVSDSRIAVANLSFVPGARFHVAEAELLDLEVRLRLALASPVPGEHLDLGALDRRLRRIPRQVRGAPAIATKVAGLRLLLLLVQGRALEASRKIPIVSAGLDVYAGRLALVMRRATGRGTGEALHRSPQLEGLKEEFSLTDAMIRVLASKRSDADFTQLMRAVFGAASCKMTKTERAVGAAPVLGNYEIKSDDTQELTIRVAVGLNELEFIVKQPLRSLQADERVRRNLEMAVAIIQSLHLNEALAASEKAAGVGMATQMLAHDVRKPFSLLRITMSQMRAAATPAECRAALARGEEAVERALAQAEGMIQDVMDLGSRKATRQRDTSLVQVIEESLAETRDVVEGSLPCVDCRFEHRSPACIDPLRIQRVLHNLLQNAAQAAGPSGRIWIETSETATEIQVVIGNDGSTIPPEELEQVFEAFYTKGKAGGTGLGLTIAKQIIGDHQGMIWCRSAPETGTEFCFTLPKSREGTLVPESDARSCVVILDDDPFILEAWQASLTECDVAAYLDPGTFLAELNAGKIHARDLACIITDYHFADDVLDASLAQLRQLNVPLILSTDALLPRAAPDFHGIIEKVPLGKAGLWRLLEEGRP